MLRSQYCYSMRNMQGAAASARQVSSDDAGGPMCASFPFVVYYLPCHSNLKHQPSTRRTPRPHQSYRHKEPAPAALSTTETKAETRPTSRRPAGRTFVHHRPMHTLPRFAMATWGIITTHNSLKPRHRAACHPLVGGLSVLVITRARTDGPQPQSQQQPNHDARRVAKEEATEYTMLNRGLTDYSWLLLCAPRNRWNHRSPLS